MRFAPLAVLLALMIGCGKKSADSATDAPPPGPSGDPDAADRDQAAARLKQIGVAMHAFEGTNGFLPAGVVSKGGAVGLSWRVQLLPFVEQVELFKQFKLDEPWDSEHNKKLLDKMPDIFATGGPAGHTHFRTTAGQHGLIREAPTPKKGPPVNLHAHRTPGTFVPGATLATISDGTSGTLMVVTADPVPWTKPDEVGVGREEYARPDNFALPKLGGMFPDGFHGLMADGKVCFFPDTLKPESVRALLTPQGGEVLPPDANVVVFPPKPPAEPPPAGAPDDAEKLAVANLQKIVLAAHDYHDAVGTLPPGTAKLSWRVQILPHLGEDELFKKFRFDQDWDSPHNHPLLAEMPKVFASPGKKAGVGETFLRTTQGPAGMIQTQANGPPRGRSIVQIPDGTSITAFVVEAADAVPWTKPGELPLSGNYSEKAATVVPKLGGVVDGGFHAGMADGSVIFFKSAMQPRDVFRLLAPADGEFFDVDAHAAYKVPMPKRAAAGQPPQTKK